MSEAAQFDPSLLGEAIEAARRSLRQLDEEHVPAKLRDLAGRSGKLPLPLVRRLLTALDASDWLRAEAAAELPADGETASSLFLRRPAGWREELAEITSRATVSNNEIKTKKLEAELRRALSKVTKLEESLARSKEREAKANSSAREKAKAESAKRDRSLAAQQDIIDRLEKEIATIEEKLAQHDQENRDLRERLEVLRSLQRRRTGPNATPSPGPGWAPRDPVKLARHLDDVMRASLAPVVVADKREAQLSRSPVVLPADTRPDQAESILWLIGLPEPAIVAIDGWNAAHQLKSPPGSSERDRVIEAARRIGIASKGRRSVLVVFDSSQGSDSFSTKDLQVRFVPSADDELIEEAASASSGLIVITSDRRVREAVEAQGAVGLWSEALVDWITTAGRRTFGA